VDSNGKLFRDNARVTFLKAKKCVYQSTVKPSRDSSVLVELRIGPESWRSDAKVQAVSPAGPERDGFRVTLELERAHTAVIETADEDPPPPAKASASASASETRPSPAADAPPIPQEMPAPQVSPPPAALPADVIADIVRSLMASEVEQWKREAQNTADRQTDLIRSLVASEIAQSKRETQDLVAHQVESAVRQPLTRLEAAIQQHLHKQPALTPDSVRKIADQAAEDAQIEWATTSQKIVAEAVRVSLASERDQQRRELPGIVAGEMEAAWKGPLAARIGARVEETINAKLDESSRKKPAITETTVRQLAAQVAEGIQLEWASTKLQKMVAEAIRSSMAADKKQRQDEISAAVSGEVEAVIRGSLSAQLDAAVEKALAAHIEQYCRTPSVMNIWKELIAEAVRQPLKAEYEQRARQVQAVVSSEIASAVRGPIAAQMDEILRKALEAQRAEYARTPPPITEDTLRQITANIVQHPQFQDSLDSLAATLTERWTEIARSATAGAQQDMNSRIAATERLANQVILDIQQKLASFSAEMNHMLGVPEAPASEGSSERADEPERDKRFRELLQSTGAHFEREMRAALQKIFGKS
jgi:uncharacterized protein YneF (UPF0154 family)